MKNILLQAFKACMESFYISVPYSDVPHVYHEEHSRNVLIEIERERRGLRKAIPDDIGGEPAFPERPKLKIYRGPDGPEF